MMKIKRDTLLNKYLPMLDKVIKWEELSGAVHSSTYRKVINAIPAKYIIFVDSILLDVDGIWIYLKEEYEFDDGRMCGGTCHADTLKEVKEQFKYGVIVRQGF